MPILHCILYVLSCLREVTLADCCYNIMCYSIPICNLNLTIQSEWVQPRVCVLDVTIEGGVVPSHSDGVLADVVAEFRRVVAEAVVVQACFHICILPMKEETCYRHIALGVQPCLAYMLILVSCYFTLLLP